MVNMTSSVTEVKQMNLKRQMVESSSQEILDPTKVHCAIDRPQWATKLDYMLSLIGFSVGLGNLWRFPYLCNRNGGGAFLIPFVFFVVVCGLPMFFMEVTLAQFSAKGPTGLWEICPFFRGIGIAMPVISWLISLYYNMIIAWCIYYIVRSCSKTLPWTTCGNWWNTPYCTEDVKRETNGSFGDQSPFRNSTYSTISTLPPDEVTGPKLKTDVYTSVTNATFVHSSVEEFWQYNTLRISSGFGDLGSVQWHLALCLLAAWIIVFFCLIRGVRSVGKVVWVTATLPYVLLLVLLIRGLTMPGALDGIVYYLKPDFNKILEVEVWLEACVQVFYSLGPTWGGILTMASYNKFSNNCLRDCVIVTFVSEGTSVFAGFVIFTFLGVMAKHQGVDVSEVVSSGPGLGFVVYPQALSQLPIPQMWSFIFFVMLLMVGLDSLFVNFEVAATSLCDTFPEYFLRHRLWVTAFLAFISFLLGLMLCCNGGIYVFQLLDWYVAALILIVGILECIIVAWIYGFYRMDKDLKMMIGKPVPRFFKIILSTITPISLTVATGRSTDRNLGLGSLSSNNGHVYYLIKIAGFLTLIDYKTPTYGKYVFPWYSALIGWIWAGIPIVPIPIVMAEQIWKATGSLKNRFLQTLTPSKEWKPNSMKFQIEYNHRQPPSLRKSFNSVFVCKENKDECDKHSVN